MMGVFDRDGYHFFSYIPEPPAPTKPEPDAEEMSEPAADDPEERDGQSPRPDLGGH